MLFEVFPGDILVILFFLFLLFKARFESLILLLLLLEFLKEFLNTLCVTVIFRLLVLVSDLMDLLIPTMDGSLLILFLFLILLSVLLFFVLELYAILFLL